MKRGEFRVSTRLGVVLVSDYAAKDSETLAIVWYDADDGAHCTIIDEQETIAYPEIPKRLIQMREIMGAK